MNDDDVDILKAALKVGLMVLLRCDFAIPEPGGLNKWRTSNMRVTGIGVADDEEVAFLEDGTYAALLATDREEFLICTVLPSPWTKEAE